MPACSVPARLLLLTALLCPSALAQRTPEELAGALQAAARAGDAAAYRDLLRPDGTFAVEAANFAADLGRVPQPTATFTLLDVAVQGPQARARLKLSWERRPGQPTQTSLPVNLYRDGGVWLYGGEAWSVLSAGPYTVLALNDPGLPERATGVAPLLSQAAGRVREVLGLDVPPAVTVKVYPTMTVLSASVALSLQPVGGWNEPGEAIKLVLPGGERAEADLLRVLAHELTHLSVSAAAGAGRDKRIPWWLHEGLADFVARGYWTPQAVRSRQERVAGYAAADWVPLPELGDFTAVPEARWSHVYGQGLGLVEFLAATRGQAAPRKLALAFADAGEADGAARALGFTSFAALEGEARSWLAAR